MRKFKFNNFLNNKNQRSLRILNIFLSFISFIYLFRTFQLEISLIKLSIEYLIFCLLIVLMNIFLASAWSYLYYNKFLLDVVATWLISGIGKYVPFKIGLISKRYIYSNLYKSEKSFSKYLLFEFLLNFSVFFILSLIGFLNYKVYLFLFIFALLIFLRNKFNLQVFFCYFMSFILNSLALTYFYLLNFAKIDTNFVFNYILTSVIGNLFIGAPAGIGIRESILMNNTIFYNLESGFFTLIVVLRVLYIFSDVLSYTFGIFLLNFSKKVK